jgi:hypothetical protein
MTESTDQRSTVPAEAAPPVASADAALLASTTTPVLEPVRPTAAPISPVVSRRRGGGGGTAFLVVGAIVLAGGLGFAAGRVTAPASAASRVAGLSGLGDGAFPFATAAPGQGGTTVGPLPSGAVGGFGPGALLGAGSGITVEGTVSAIAADSLTLAVNGTSTEVKTDASTTYHRQAVATAADVTVGSKVLVRVSGFGGRAMVGGQGGPSASSAPRASAVAGAPAGGLPTFTATDVTIAAQ